MVMMFTHGARLVSPGADSRRYFLGGSDARIIMGNDEAACFACGGRNVAKSSLRTFPATSSSSSALPPRTLV